MFANFDTPTKLMLGGDISLVACGVFYLLWWIFAFRPDDPIKGMRSGWLLIPAVVFGVLAAVLVIRGGCDESVAMPFPRMAVLVGGIAVYVVLLVLTSILLKRQVTTELFLIVGWAALMFLEIGALQGQGRLTTVAMIVLLVVMVVVAAASLVCYLLYYDLDGVRGYVDGMIPLILIIVAVAVVMIVVTARGGV